MQPDLEQSHISAAPSASTDYSQQSLANLAHSHDSVGVGVYANHFDFSGGLINISGAFEPAIDLSAYDGFASQSADLDALHALARLGQDAYSLGLESAALVDVVGAATQDPADLAFYSTKPNWQHANLISHLETAAEHFQSYMEHEQATQGHDVLHAHTLADVTQGGELIAHGGLHDGGHVESNLWDLQSPFREDAVGGAGECGNGRRDSKLGQDGGLDLLELIERDQRARGY